MQLIFGTILLIYSINYKRIHKYFKENKKKGYDLFYNIINDLILIISFVFITHLVINHKISNYSEAYEKCCINHISSNKV